MYANEGIDQNIFLNLYHSTKNGQQPSDNVEY